MGLSLGKIVTDKTQLGRRDAFHAPCVLVSSNCHIRPGEPLCFYGSVVVPADGGEKHGIADPFVKSLILPNQLFWMLLDPAFVGELTHYFTIQGIDDVPAAPPNPLPAPTVGVAEQQNPGKEPWEDSQPAAPPKAKEKDLSDVAWGDDEDNGSGCGYSGC